MLVDSPVELVKARFEKAQRLRGALIKRAKEAGIDSHPLACVCERCNAFWGVRLRGSEGNKYGRDR